MSTEHRVRIGEYEFVARPDHVTVSILRDGRPTETYSEAIKAAMQSIDAARVVVCAARTMLLSRSQDPGIVERALRRHDMLVDDHEPPSAWCGGGARAAANVGPDEAPSADEPRLTDDEMILAQQTLTDARRAGQRIRTSALEKLIAFYKRAVAP